MSNGLKPLTEEFLNQQWERMTLEEKRRTVIGMECPKDYYNGVSESCGVDDCIDCWRKVQEKWENGRSKV